MRISIPALALASSLAFTLVHADTTYMNQIRQTNSFKNEEGILIQTEQLLTGLENKGSKQAAAGVMGVSVFKLMTIVQDDSLQAPEAYILDTETVSSYLADAQIKIIGPSADPYNSNSDNSPNHIPRTQVGQGFTIEYTVSGLLPETVDTPEAASSVLLEHSTYSYDESGDSVKLGADPNSHERIDLSKNTTIRQWVSTSLTGADLTKVRGEEIFTIYMKPEADHPELKELDAAKVIIWPLSDGKLSGIQTGAVYSKIPALSVDLIDLYPGSDTYLSITGGDLERPLTYGNRKNTGLTPLSVKYDLENLDQELKASGIYTVKLIHQSPFETVLFDTISFQVERTIRIKAQIITSE